MKKQQISRDAVLAALPAEAPAWELHGAVSRKASDALHNHLRAAQWERNHERKSYDAAEWAERHGRLVAERKAAAKARRLWDRAEDASAAALAQIPRSLHGATYSREAWGARMGYRTP